jgi:shikimate dehydrogenase
MLAGDNTDWSGFQADLERHGIQVAGRDCLILGAGGSARAVAYALAFDGGRITILARRPAQAAAVATALGLHFPGRLLAGSLEELPAWAAAVTAPLIVNTTPLGMERDAAASPWPAALPFPAGSFIYDLVYRPAQTPLLQQAAHSGCAAANGLGMLAFQAAQAFRLWTGAGAEVVEQFVRFAGQAAAGADGRQPTSLQELL